MASQTEDPFNKLERDGFVLIPQVFTGDQGAAILSGLESSFQGQEEAARRTENGNVFAARNVLQLWPPATSIWRQVPLPDLLRDCLGSEFGLVRGLYFDKPPDRSWALPWHKDLTISVRQHRSSSMFIHPTTKAGVPHVEAPCHILQTMLTARIHLDDVTPENGPLQVIPGSHNQGKEMDFERAKPEPILANRGDVLLIRPLVTHCSGGAEPGTQRHRRILHLEFAASARLPDGFEWYEFFAESGPQ